MAFPREAFYTPRVSLPGIPSYMLNTSYDTLSDLQSKDARAKYNVMQVEALKDAQAMKDELKQQLGDIPLEDLSLEDALSIQAKIGLKHGKTKSAIALKKLQKEERELKDKLEEQAQKKRNQVLKDAVNIFSKNPELAKDFLEQNDLEEYIPVVEKTKKPTTNIMPRKMIDLRDGSSVIINTNEGLAAALKNPFLAPESVIMQQNSDYLENLSKYGQGYIPEGYTPVRNKATGEIALAPNNARGDRARVMNEGRPEQFDSATTGLYRYLFGE